MSKYIIKNVLGMDVGDSNIHICVLDRDGDVVESLSIENSIGSLNGYFDRFDTPRQVLVAIETGTHSPWISHLLQARGFKVLVGNARKLRMIWNSPHKDDPGWSRCVNIRADPGTGIFNQRDSENIDQPLP